MLTNDLPPPRPGFPGLDPSAALAAPKVPDGLIKPKKDSPSRSPRMKRTSTSQRGVLPATLGEALAAFFQAHPDLETKDIRRAMIALIEVTAEDHAGADRAVKTAERSNRPKSERLQQMLASVPTELLVEGDLAVLFAPDRVAEQLDKSVPTARQYGSRLKRVRQWLLKQYRGRLHLLGHLKTPAWRRLVDQAGGLTGRKGAGNRVGWLGRYGEAQGITPDQLATEHTRAFWSWLATDSGLKKGYDSLYYGAGRDWVALAEIGVVPPVAFYKKRQDQDRYILSPQEVPANFREGFEYFAYQATAEEVSTRPTQRQICAGTLDNYRQAYYGLLGVMQQQGVDLAGVSVPDLFLDSAHIDALCQKFWQEAGGQWHRIHKDRLDQLHRIGKCLLTRHDPKADLQPLDWIQAQMSRMKGMRPVHPLPVIPPEDVDRMIRAVERELVARQKREAGPSSFLVPRRDLFVLRFLYDRANRVGDLEHMQWVEGSPPAPSAKVDDPVHGYLSITPPFVYRVCTKPGSIDQARVPLDARSAWREYIAVRQQLGFDSPWLLVSDEGHHLYQGGVTHRVAYWAARVGFHMTAQGFRRVFATEELDDHNDPELLKAMRGSRSTQVIHGHYDTRDCQQASQQWNDLIEAHLDDRPEALPLAMQRLLERAAKEDAVRALLCQARDLVDAETEAAV